MFQKRMKGLTDVFISKLIRVLLTKFLNLAYFSIFLNLDICFVSTDTESKSSHQLYWLDTYTDPPVPSQYLFSPCSIVVVSDIYGKKSKLEYLIITLI